MAVRSDWLEKDFYEVLGVPEKASDKEVTRAYRRLARQLHPDANPGNPEAEERFKEVSAAYDVIGDAEKRKEYDEFRRLAAAPGFGPRRQGRGPSGGFDVHFEDVGDLGDFTDLGDLLGGLFGHAGGRARPRPARRGRDVEAELQLGFEDAVAGLTTTLTLTTDAPCTTCGGSGVVVEQPCPTCSGGGVERRPRQVNVRIPPGVDDGQRIRIPGRGEPGRDGAGSGDLYVTVRVAPHPLFGRKGRDLTLKVPVTYPEAVLGAEVKVPTLDGDPVTLRIPPGTASGRTFRVRGRGVPSARGRGDLLVTVEVAVPSAVSGPERAAVETLAQVGGPSPRAHLGV